MKLVSIIVPVYNRSNKIIDCYNSLIKQTYKNIEIIFVNDGSTDDTLNVLKKFEDQRVVVIDQCNTGPSEARRVGFNKSHGDYICFVDSDDWISRDYIKRLVKSIEKNNSNIAIGRLGVHYYYPVVRRIVLKVKNKPMKIDLESNKEYLPGLTPGIVGKLFRRELLNLKEVKFMANEDIVTMYPLYVKCRYISFDNKAIYHYNLAETSQFKEYLLGYSLNNLLNTFEPLRYIYEEFDRTSKLEDYYYELEMLFIKNISERIWNIVQCVDDKIYRYKFISAILDYLECFFPDWDSNPYYIKGYRIGEVSDIFHVMKAREVIKKFKRKKIYLDVEDVYDRYKTIEKLYNNSK